MQYFVILYQESCKFLKMIPKEKNQNQGSLFFHLVTH
jgi:hypothetical protein